MLENLQYPRPEEQYRFVERKRVNGKCPECGSDNIARYPIMHHMGPRMATKCQDCLYTLKLEYPKREDHWPPYWPVTWDWKPSPVG